jgi:long-chain acyl-CoA synthetase
VKIAGDSEILCKGPNIMRGYFKEPDMTGEAVEPDGWFHTGDLGHLEPGGFLKITGRKKELFKTSFGKYISPQPIEDTFKESLFIDQIIVIGENQKFAGALIVPDFVFLKSYCAVKEIPYTSNSEIIRMPRIRKRFQVEVDRYNKFFGDTEKIKTWDLLDTEWSFETGEITPTLKLKRNVIIEKYKDGITKLFE